MFGIPTALDTGWRSPYSRPGLRCAWVLRHDDHEHVLVFYQGAAGTLESLVARTRAGCGHRRLVCTGATVISTQIVRFGRGAAPTRSNWNRCADAASATVGAARLLAACVPAAAARTGLARYCTDDDVRDVFGAPAGLQYVFEASSATWVNMPGTFR